MEVDLPTKLEPPIAYRPFEVKGLSDPCEAALNAINANGGIPVGLTDCAVHLCVHHPRL